MSDTLDVAQIRIRYGEDKTSKATHLNYRGTGDILLCFSYWDSK